MNNKETTFVYILLIVSLLVSCTESVTNTEKVDRFPDIYPDYIGVTIPAGIAPMDFNVEEMGCEKVDVIAKGSKEGEIHTQGEWAEWDIDEWHQLTRNNIGGSIDFTVRAKNEDGIWKEYRSFKMYVSKYPLDDFGITYRRIQPGYEVGGNIGIYQRDIHSFDEYPMMTETALPGKCFNCHTANRTNPRQYTTQVRGEGGGTLVVKDGKQTWYDTKTDSTKAAGSYASWHPDGRYCAYAVNSVHQSFFTDKDRNLEVYHSFGDIMVLETEKGELLLSPLLRTNDVEIFPAFSADGKTLYYSTSKECQVPAEYEKVQCSLCAIDFDAKSGTFGNKVDTLLNGPATDKSYVLARPSYDGRWLMYCVADRCNFPVSQRESDLWLMDLRTGKTSPIKEVNTKESESYHNWSGNSRWFVYSSKGEDGMYSRAYIASVDENGKVTKPFLLPQRNPRNFYRNMFDSYNCPDFTKTKVDFDIRKAREELTTGVRTPVVVRDRN